MRHAVRVCALLLLATSLCRAQAPEAIRHRLDRLTTSDSTPSIAVAVARNGAIVWEEAFGWADKEHHQRASIHTPYNVASVTKTLTATELLILSRAHRLDLDRPANAYLADLPDSVRVSSPAWNAAQVTVHRLANHTAGLATHYLFCFTDTPNCRASVSEAIARYAVAIRLPGERFDYSNLGYGTLGAVIERVTGHPLGEAMRSDVFVPLRLGDTFIGPAGTRPGVAVSYDWKGRRADGYRSTTPAASDGYASIHDLARFGLFQLHAHLSDQERVITDSAIDWMQTGTVRADEHYQYGFGWWVEPDHLGLREVYAAGGTNVASALLVLVPAEHLAVAITTNAPLLLTDIADDVIALYVPAFAARRAASTGSSTPSTPQRPTRPDAALVGSWAGWIATYRGRVPLTMRVDSLGTVRTSVAGAPDADLSDVRFSDDARVCPVPSPGRCRSTSSRDGNTISSRSSRCTAIERPAMSRRRWIRAPWKGWG
jgi:CubicO group peptidase (beta-lactamase class C family)